MSRGGEILTGKNAAIAAAGLAFAFGTYEIGKSGNDNPLKADTAAAAPNLAAVDCASMDGLETPTLAPETILEMPKDGLDTPAKADEYINDKPFANGKKIGIVSLAGLNGTLTIPATKKTTNLSSEYVTNFNNSMKEYTNSDSDQALEDAKEDCAETQRLLDQSANWKEDLSKKGENLVQVVPVGSGEDTTIKMVKRDSLDLGAGIEVSISDDASERKDSNGDEYNGFNKAYIVDGKLYLVGVRPDDTKGNGQKEEGKEGGHDKKDRKNSGDAKHGEAGGQDKKSDKNTGDAKHGEAGGTDQKNKAKSNNGGGSSGGNRGNTQGERGTNHGDQGKCGGCGQDNCSAGCKGTGNGGGGSGGGGGGTGTGTNPGPTKTPNPGPTETPAPTSTPGPVKTPAPTPSPTSTPQPTPTPSKPPMNCDPNIDVCDSSAKMSVTAVKTAQGWRIYNA